MSPGLSDPKAHVPTQKPTFLNNEMVVKARAALTVELQQDNMGENVDTGKVCGK